MAFLPETPHFAFVSFKIGDLDLTPIPPQHLEQFNYERVTKTGVGNKILLTVHDQTAVEIESALANGSHDCEFYYGYTDGFQSKVFTGTITQYDPAFTSVGVSLALEGTSQALAESIADPKSITYKKMLISDIVKAEADSNGWYYDDTTIEETAPVKESEEYSITTTLGSGAGAAGAAGGGSASEGGVVANFNDTAFVGDSMMARIKSKLESEFPGVTIYAISGKNFDWISSQIDSVGADKTKVVVGMGNNDPNGVSVDQGNQIMQKLGSSRQVFFVTMLVTNNNTSTTNTNNTINALASTNSNVHVINWHDAANSDTSKYLIDNVHQSEPDGVDLYVKILHNAIGVVGTPENSDTPAGTSAILNDGNQTRTQQLLVEACGETSSTSVLRDVNWISDVFKSIDLDVNSLDLINADELCDAYCHSSNLSELKPGMLIACHPSGASGNEHGHAGIYIGNEKVAHNVGKIAIDNLYDWINTYGPNGEYHGGEVKWGWNGGIDLSAR